MRSTVTKFVCFCTLGALGILQGISPAVADFTYVSDSSVVTPVVSNEFQWGSSTQAEAIFKFPTIPVQTSLNPPGSPIWDVTKFYEFEYQYSVATGTSTMKIDFSDDGDFLDADEVSSFSHPSFVNVRQDYIGVLGQGQNQPGNLVTLNNLTINGSNKGSFAGSFNSPFRKLFQYNGVGPWDITVTGSFNFNNGGNNERPRFFIQLGTPIAVPEPGALGALGLLAMTGLVRRRRR